MTKYNAETLERSYALLDDQQYCSGIDEGKKQAVDLSARIFQAATNGNINACMFWLKHRCPNEWGQGAGTCTVSD